MQPDKEACILCIITCTLSISGCTYIIKNILQMEDRGFGAELLGLVSSSYFVYSSLSQLDSIMHLAGVTLNDTHCLLLAYFKTFSLLAGIMWSSIIACGL